MSNRGVKFITYGWLGFITENLIISHNREYLIERLGSEITYK